MRVTNEAWLDLCFVSQDAVNAEMYPDPMALRCQDRGLDETTSKHTFISSSF